MAVAVRRPGRQDQRQVGQGVVIARGLGGAVGALGYGWAGVAFSAPLGLSLLAISVPRLRG